MTESPLPSPEEVSSRLLETLRTDGDQWLWEMVWGLNREFPSVPVEEKVALARQVVMALTLQAKIELWRGQWPTGPVSPLTQQEMAHVLAASAPWHDPESADLMVVIEAAGSH